MEQRYQMEFLESGSYTTIEAIEINKLNQFKDSHSCLVVVTRDVNKYHFAFYLHERYRDYCTAGATNHLLLVGVDTNKLSSHKIESTPK
jgi:hypothetical protein